MTEVGSDCSKQPLKNHRWDKEEEEEATVSLAAAKEISLDAAVADV